MKVTCTICCNSVQTMRKAIEFAQDYVHPDKEVIQTFISLPGGRETKVSRISDYFEEVELLPSELDDSFMLTFHIKEGADSHWKFLVVNFPQAIKENVPKVKIRLEMSK